ncbi:hypothetical protein AAT19DRAFT_9979 [Rhodotorula toruloides]|uniref:Uncharacterized protein n=1 Tax=Rhodotorula toruloides TaxID=5286 RepID=A0A2T0A1I6_RHOTO|nr:hypothetical protein AAT19DRAFT_9979 [Rhodotorula toruloides]
MTWDSRAQVFQTLDRLRTNPAAAAVAVLAVLISLGLMGLFSRAQRFEVAGKHCYIGGGSEGLGLSLACQLADHGAHVTIVSRSQSKLDRALQELETHRQKPSQVFQALSCDLTDPAAAASTLRQACKATPSSSPDYLFACAGGCVPGYFAEMPAEQHWQCMEWNFRTCLNTVHEGVKAMKEDGKKGGGVVLTSSVLALMSFAGYSSYSPSKSRRSTTQRAATLRHFRSPLPPRHHFLTRLRERAAAETGDYEEDRGTGRGDEAGCRSEGADQGRRARRLLHYLRTSRPHAPQQPRHHAAQQHSFRLFLGSRGYYCVPHLAADVSGRQSQQGGEAYTRVVG